MGRKFKFWEKGIRLFFNYNTKEYGNVSFFPWEYGYYFTESSIAFSFSEPETVTVADSLNVEKSLSLLKVETVTVTDSLTVETSYPNQYWCGLAKSNTLNTEYFNATVVTNQYDFTGAGEVMDFWGPSSTDVWAIAYASGSSTYLWHWDGLTWTENVAMRGGVGTQYGQIHGRTTNEVYLTKQNSANNGGWVYKWNGLSWSEIFSSVTIIPTSVWCPPNSTEVFIGLRNHASGSIAKLSTGFAVDVTSPTSIVVTSISGNSVNDFYYCDSTMLVYRYQTGVGYVTDDATVKAVDNQAYGYAKNVWVDTLGNVFVAGRSGVYGCIKEKVGGAWNVWIDTSSGTRLYGVSGRSLTDTLFTGIGGIWRKYAGGVSYTKGTFATASDRDCCFAVPKNQKDYP